MSRFRKLLLIALATALTALVVTVVGLAGTAQTVAVTAGKPTEFRFTLSKKTVKKGAVVFTVTNKGLLEHNFKIAGKKSPTLLKGKRGTLTVTFKKAGKYPFLCTIEGHAAEGMKGTLIVK